MSSKFHGVFADIEILLRRETDGRGQVAVAPELAVWFNAMAAPAAATLNSIPRNEGVRVAAAPEKTMDWAPTREAVPARAPVPQALDAAPQGRATEVAARAATLDELAAAVAGCTRCGLCQTRTQTVFSDGNATADLVFVGEAPGEDEDRQGIPFVGRAGQLLTKIIEASGSMGLRRQEDVYICNVLKCRPPGNRTPAPEEMFECEPFLMRQLALVKPKVICALGGVAAKQLLKTDAPVGRLRGKWHSYQGIPVRVTYHPSYLLRLSGEQEKTEKRKVLEDVQAVMRVLRGEETPA